MNVRDGVLQNFGGSLIGESIVVGVAREAALSISYIYPLGAEKAREPSL